MVVIYKADSDASKYVVAALLKEGFDVVAMSNPAKRSMHLFDHHPYLKTKPIVYISVPRDQRAGSKVALKKWLIESDKKISKLTGKTFQDAMKAVVFGVFVGFVMYVFGFEFEEYIGCGVGAAMLIFIIFIGFPRRTDK